jgi:predicted aspartyl protease
MRAVCAIAVLLAGCCAAAGQNDAALQAAFENHRWFDLRDAVAAGQAPPLYRAAVAAVFNHISRAETEFRTVTRPGAAPDALSIAHQMLSDLYMRNGLYRKAATEVRRKRAARPEKAPSAEERSAIASLERLPDLKLVSRRPATVRYTVTDGGVVAPLTVNGHAVRFELDSGSNMSVISEAEAKSLGMTFNTAAVPVEGVTGSTEGGARFAIADRLTIGGTEFRNVAFLVLRDDQEPFAERPLGERGIVGLPVMIAVGTFRWGHGELTLAFPTAGFIAGRANLCFEASFPLTVVEIDGRRVSFLFDTGGENSELWPLFASAFPTRLVGAKDGAKDLTGFTGTASVSAAILPTLDIKLGGLPVVFHDAPVLRQNTVAPSKWHYGRIGMDLLNQASEVTLDFAALTIQLR